MDGSHEQTNFLETIVLDVPTDIQMIRKYRKLFEISERLENDFFYKRNGVGYCLAIITMNWLRNRRIRTGSHIVYRRVTDNFPRIMNKNHKISSSFISLYLRSLGSNIFILICAERCL